MPDAFDDQRLDELRLHIERWLAEQLDENPIVAAVELDTENPRRWHVRLTGEEKDSFTIRFELKQRTLFYETYVMPAPIENHAEFYLHLLRRNKGLYGAAFVIAEEDAVFLQGQLDNSLAFNGDDELDRVLGSLYVWVEQFFKPALKIGYRSKFT